MPIDGAVPRIPIDEVYGKGLPSIPPALPQKAATEHFDSSASFLNLDAGAVTQGARLTGSSTGGVLIGAAVSLLSSWLHSKETDAKRSPGIARAVVRMHVKDTRQGFSVIAAADTPETPDTLFDCVFDAITNALTSGVPAKPNLDAKQ
jgi:hypothetical protein